MRRLVNSIFTTILLVNVTSGAVFAQTENALPEQLFALLEQERAALSAIPDDQFMALTRLEPQSEPSVDVTSTGFDYSYDYIDALPKATGGPQWRCLSEALYFEARGESARGLFAVGEVILNRVDDARYPDSLCSVINQGTGRKFACQFTYTCDGLAERIHEPAAFERVAKVARELMDGAPRNLTGGATHYHTKAVNPYWAKRFPQTAEIGFHYFYRQPSRRASN